MADFRIQNMKGKILAFLEADICVVAVCTVLWTYCTDKSFPASMHRFCSKGPPMTLQSSAASALTNNFKPCSLGSLLPDMMLLFGDLHLASTRVERVKLARSHKYHFSLPLGLRRVSQRFPGKLERKDSSSLLPCCDIQWKFGVGQLSVSSKEDDRFGTDDLGIRLMIQRIFSIHSKIRGYHTPCCKQT